MNTRGANEVQRVADMARELSGSKRWSKLLDTMERRVRFEDGFVQGWFAHKARNKKKEVKP